MRVHQPMALVLSLVDSQAARQGRHQCQGTRCRLRQVAPRLCEVPAAIPRPLCPRSQTKQAMLPIRHDAPPDGL